MAKAAHKLDACFLLQVMILRTNTCFHCLLLKRVDPSAFRPDVQIEPSQEVPVGSKFLKMNDGAQAVGGRLGVRCAAGSVFADEQATAKPGM